MNIAVETNIIVFQTNGKDGEPPRGVAPAQAVDAVRQAWRQVREKRQIEASDVTGVRSTWQVSRMDRIFLAGTFPGAEYSYQFDRPDEDDWSKAFELASKASALPGFGEETVLKAEKDGEWLPILHTYDGPLKLYASLPLVEGRLYLGFAKSTIMPTGRIAMSHLLRNQLEEMSEDELSGFINEALDNLTRGLVFKGHEDKTKGHLLTLERSDNNLCAGSAIVLEDFHERVAQLIGEDKIIVGLVSPDHIYVAGASSGWIDEITDWIRTSPDTSGDLIPCVLRIDGSGHMDVIAERPTGRAPAQPPE
ncbi:hypothetical protein ABZ639_24520 [Saccharomonospora sp. NPDC006951]